MNERFLYLSISYISVKIHSYRDLIILENQSSSFPNREETEFGEIDYTAIKTAVQEPKKKRSNSKYNENERCLIGKYAAINGTAAAVKKFKRSHPHLKLGESMVRHLRDKYHKVIKTNGNITKIKKSKVGRPLMLGVVDEQVKKFFICSFAQKGWCRQHSGSSSNSKSFHFL